MNSDQRKRVLVVDDHEEIRSLLQTLLQQRGLLVDAADGGREAIDRLRQHSYSVVVLDLLMPEVDGFAVVERMGQDDITLPPVVLVITGAERKAVDRLDPRKIHGVVRKPFDAPELADLVLACAELRSRNFGAMAIATMIAGTPLLALINRMTH